MMSKPTFVDKLITYQVKSIQLSNFFRQHVSSLREKVPLNCFLQTDCCLIGGSLYFESSCNTLPDFGFNSRRYDINLIESYLLPVLVNDRDLELINIKKTNPFVSFDFGNFQLLDILNFLVGDTVLDSFVKASKTSQMKGFFPEKWFRYPDNLNNKEFSLYAALHNKLRNWNLLEKEYLHYEILICSGLATEFALVKMRRSEIPLNWAENYSYLQKICEPDKIQLFKDFSLW